MANFFEQIARDPHHDAAMTAADQLKQLRGLLGETADEWTENRPYLPTVKKTFIGRPYVAGDVARLTAIVRTSDLVADIERGLLRWSDRFVAAQVA